MKTARLLLRHIRKEKIIQRRKAAAAGCLRVPLAYSADSVRRESRHIPNPTGCAINAAKNGKYEQSGPAVDRVHENVPKVQRMSSDAGTQLFYRRLSAAALRKVYRDCNRAYPGYHGVLFSAGIFPEPAGDAAADDRRDTAGNDILRIDQREKAVHRNPVRFRGDEGMYPDRQRDCVVCRSADAAYRICGLSAGFQEKEKMTKW